MVRSLKWISLCFVALLFCCSQAWGWSSETHMFIAEEAGLEYPLTACFPDLSKKDNDALLGPFHWHNAAPTTVVDASYIDKFRVVQEPYVKRSSPESKSISIRVPHPAGVLYWEITDLYKKLQGKTGWVREYYLANLSHYVADLSMPLHNFPHGKDPASDGLAYPEIGNWAKNNHGKFDEALDSWLPLTAARRQKFNQQLTPVTITSEAQLKAEVAKVANKSIALANKCYSEQQRPMTKDEALTQAAMSVSLLQAIVKSTEPE